MAAMSVTLTLRLLHTTTSLVIRRLEECADRPTAALLDARLVIDVLVDAARIVINIGTIVVCSLATFERQRASTMAAIVFALNETVIGIRAVAAALRRVAEMRALEKRALTTTTTVEEKDELCAICCRTLRRDVRVTRCGHRYHAFCIRKWISVRAVCPCCYALLSDVKDEQLATPTQEGADIKTAGHMMESADT